MLGICSLAHDSASLHLQKKSNAPNHPPNCFRRRSWNVFGRSKGDGWLWQLFSPLIPASAQTRSTPEVVRTDGKGDPNACIMLVHSLITHHWIACASTPTATILHNSCALRFLFDDGYPHPPPRFFEPLPRRLAPPESVQRG